MSFLSRLVSLEHDKLVLVKLWLICISLIIDTVYLINRHTLFLEILKGVFRHIDLGPSPVLDLFLGHLFSGEVFSCKAQQLCLYPQQHILRYQDHRLGQIFRQPFTHFQYPVVLFVLMEILGQLDVYIVLFYPEKPSVFHLHSIGQQASHSQLLQRPYSFPGIDPSFSVVSFQVIQLFQNCYGDHDRVLLKTPESPRGLNKHISVQYIYFTHNYPFSFDFVSTIWLSYTFL